VYKEINEKLVAAREQGRMHGIWQKRLRALQEELEEREQQARLWEQQLKKEEGDVEKLKSLSFSSFLSTILQNKAEKLEHEQMEVLEAKLKYEEASHAIKGMHLEIDDLKAKIYEVRSWDVVEKKALEQKIQLIHENDTMTSRKLHELAERSAELQIIMKELSEALHEGESVSAALSQAKEALQSASNWGTYDMLGGGLLATHAKHNKLDEALDYIQRAQQSLNRFEKELRDVRVTLSIEMDMSSFLRFSDYFFDGLITDWIVQGRIQSTLAQVEAKSTAVHTILWELENEKRKNGNELAAVQNAYSVLTNDVN
jgi:DNA repair exonuclease SbcCD ATPase subunit